MGTSQIVTLPILTKLAANFKMAATTRFAKLFSGKRKAVEEGLYSFKRLNDEMANKCFTEELTFETEVAQAAGLAAVLLNKKPREERGEDELRNNTWWSQGYRNWDDAAFTNYPR